MTSSEILPGANASEPHDAFEPKLKEAATRRQEEQDMASSPSSTTEEKRLPGVKQEEAEAQEQEQEKTPEKPYSAFNKTDKWLIVGMAAIGGIFSPLTANTYFPAIPIMADAFHKSTELINLTVTAYMILQGIGPMVWGPIADRWGRRLVFLACLLVLALSCVGIALTPTNAYWLLMLLRCLQAFGSASTIAVGAGVIADVAAQHERAGFYGIWSIGPMVGPCIGPIIGGALVQGLGWRSIFWFLCICSGVWFIVMLLFFPETLRAMVGDGSIPAPAYSRALIPYVGRRSQSHDSNRPPPKPLANPFRIFLYPDVDILLVFIGIVNAVFYGVLASISSLFTEVYPFLNSTDIGLCFLSIGAGTLAGSIITGNILDREYKNLKAKHDKKVQASAAADPESGAPQVREEDFPIEVARFRTMPIYMLVLAAGSVGYGWCLERRVHLSVPLILLFIMGYATIAIFNTTQTLLIDLLPSYGSSITACNNFVRCLLGAAMVSVMDLLLNSIGMGWTYVLLAGLSVINFPGIYLIIHIGPKLRAKRGARQA